MDMIEKQCSICKETKSISEFRRDKSRKDGFHPHCKLCQLQYRRKDPNNLVRIEGEKRRHKEYNLRKGGKLTSETLTPSEKASMNLKSYYERSPEVLKKKRELIYAREEYFINSKKKINSNSIGEMFRSQLEVTFSELLILNSINYQYEKVYRMKNGKRKVVDFVIDDFILVEISGFAYQAWKDDFREKISILRESVTNPIMILSYPDKEQELRETIVTGDDIYIGNVEDTERFLKTYEFIKQIQIINKKENYDNKKII